MPLCLGRRWPAWGALRPGELSDLGSTQHNKTHGMYTRQESQVRYSSISWATKELEFYILEGGSPLECGLSLTVRVTLWPEPQITQLLEPCQAWELPRPHQGNILLTPIPSRHHLHLALPLQMGRILNWASGHANACPCECTCLEDWYLPQASRASSPLAQPAQKEHAKCRPGCNGRPVRMARGTSIFSHL